PVRGFYLGRLPLGRRAVAPLRAGATRRHETTVRIPAGAAPGSYRLLACADDRRRVRETSEVDNCRAAPAAVTVSARAGDDVTPPAFAGLVAATTCIPGPAGDGTRSAAYHL